MTTYVYLLEIRNSVWVFSDFDEAKNSALHAFAGKYKRAEMEQPPDADCAWIIRAGTRNNMKPQGHIFKEEVLYGQQDIILSKEERTPWTIPSNR